MSFASLNGGLVARKGEARPSSALHKSHSAHNQSTHNQSAHNQSAHNHSAHKTKGDVQPQASEPVKAVQPSDSSAVSGSMDFIGRVPNRREQAPTHLDGDFLQRHAGSKSIRSLETVVRQKFSAPYNHEDLSKLTIRLDKRLQEAFKIQAAMMGVSQQQLFREAIERYLVSSDWLARVD